MTWTGRKPTGIDYVNRLDGSERAQRRMRLFLATMTGQMTVAQACSDLHVCESRFHAHRQQWLQEALKLLEPRRTGRPPKTASRETTAQRLRELEAENQQLREQLQAAEVREELAQILRPTAQGETPVIKKRRGRRRRSMRRPR